MNSSTYVVGTNIAVNLLMAKPNYERMIKLVNEVFDTKNDPEQLNMTEKDREHLQLLHPATMSEYADENGPVAWILLFPTLSELMHQFIDHKITEQQLADLTPVNAAYDCIYLCSAIVLNEYRRKGIALKLTMDAIDNIRKDHSIKALFVWPFTNEGNALSEKIAAIAGLPLLTRKDAIA